MLILFHHCDQPAPQDRRDQCEHRAAPRELNSQMGKLLGEYEHLPEVDLLQILDFHVRFENDIDTHRKLISSFYSFNLYKPSAMHSNSVQRSCWTC